MGVTGLERTENSKRKTANSESGNARSNAREGNAASLADSTAATSAAFTAADPLLDRLLSAWERLTTADRERLVDEAESVTGAVADPADCSPGVTP